MPLTIRNKTALGIGGLFTLLLISSIVSFAFINLLSAKTENLLAANYKTIQYCNQMMHAIDVVHTNKQQAIDSFEKNLRLQENNITEPGEGAATQTLRTYFEMIKRGDTASYAIDSVNKQLYDISILNQQALERKNAKALATAQDAKLWISTLGVLILLIGFTFTLNFPGYISGPIHNFTEGIKEISAKNYRARIFINNKDEFGDMAHAFNGMAEKLYEFENSNISRLMFEKKRVDIIINQMEDAVIGMDGDNKILFINNIAESIFNLKANNITGKYAPDIALYNDLFRTVLQHKQTDQPLKIIVDSKENYFSLDNRDVYNDDQQIGAVYTLKNITSFKELDISKTNLLATISHELKTPISSIMMSAKLLNDNRTGQLNAEQDEFVKNISGDAERLLRITGELLNITQLESGNIQLKIQNVQPAAIVAYSLPAVQLQAESKGIQINQQIADDVADVLADPDKTSWVLINFLTNAIKYSQDNSSIRISVQAEQGKVKFSVQDFGQGIEEKYLSKIFVRYFKVPDDIKKTGTGLGLAISKEFIEAQGGRIGVESTHDQGSTFYFYLPVAGE